MTKKDDDALVIGGVALLLLMGAGKGRHPASPAPQRGGMSVPGIPWGTGWSYPVPPLDLGAVPVRYDAVISNPFASGPHYGVDVMYPRKQSTGNDTVFAPGTANGSAMYFAPPGTPILAAKDARVWSVIRSSRGWSVVLDHGRPFATFYQHLDTVNFPVHAMGFKYGTKTITTVRAGDRLGTMGGDPTQGAGALRHLHFAVWYQGHGDSSSVDPGTVMPGWLQPSPWRVT